MQAARPLVEGEEVLCNALDLHLFALIVLQAARIGGTEGGYERLILAVALIHAAEAGVARHVENGRKDVRNTECRRLLPHHAAELFLERRVEGGAPADGPRQADGVLHEKAAHALHMEDGGDMMGRERHHALLKVALQFGALLERFEGAHFERAHHADAIGAALLHALCRGLIEIAVYLRHLLVEREFF